MSVLNKGNYFLLRMTVVCWITCSVIVLRCWLCSCASSWMSLCKAAGGTSLGAHRLCLWGSRGSLQPLCLSQRCDNCVQTTASEPFITAVQAKVFAVASTACCYGAWGVVILLLQLFAPPVACRGKIPLEELGLPASTPRTAGMQHWLSSGWCSGLPLLVHSKNSQCFRIGWFLDGIWNWKGLPCQTLQCRN